MCPPGRWTKIVKRVVRSTIVAIAERFFSPMSRAPSQWPATARSAVSVERSVIITMGSTNRLLR